MADTLERDNKSLNTPLTDEDLRFLIERECGPVQRIGDMLWAIEVARAVEQAHGIGFK